MTSVSFVESSGKPAELAGAAVRESSRNSVFTVTVLGALPEVAAASEAGRAVCAALLAGEADFDELCAAGGMESDELGALLIEMEMDGLVTPLAGTRYAPGPQMRD